LLNSISFHHDYFPNGYHGGGMPLAKDISFVVDHSVAFMMIKVNLMLCQVVHSMSKVLLVHHSTCHSLLKFLFILYNLQLQVHRFCLILLCLSTNLVVCLKNRSLVCPCQVLCLKYLIPNLTFNIFIGNSA
jgi:hypothetical protein